MLNFSKKKKYSIYFLQDTHFTKKEENYIRSQWALECFFSSFSRQSRGVAILFNNNFEYKLHTVQSEDDRNKLIVEISIQEKTFSLINIYGPNRDTPEFYESINRLIHENESNVILAGDFNLVLNLDIDCFEYVNVNNPKAVLSMIDQNSLIDVFRELHFDKKSIYLEKKEH